MLRFQKQLGKQIAALPLPGIFFYDEKLLFRSVEVFDSFEPSRLGIRAEYLDIHTRVSRDVLSSVLGFRLPVLFESKTRISPAQTYLVAGDDVAIHIRVSRDTLPILADFHCPVLVESTTEILPPEIAETAISDDTFPKDLTSSDLLQFPDIRQIGIDVLPTHLAVSGNLLKGFLVVRVLGMNYHDRIWRELHPPEAKMPTIGLSSATRPLSKSYVEEGQGKRRKVKRKQPSFWDLIYAILQPSIVLNQVENLYLPHDLYPYQPAGIQFLMNHDSALLADEMGTGKTVMTTVALRILVQKGRVNYALIVSPLSVLREWDRHLTEWAPDLLVTFVRGGKSERTLDWHMPAHVYVTTYDTLRSDIESGVLSEDSLGKFDVVVLDEAQNIKNPVSGRSRAAKRLRTRQRWALTGTPIENKIDDVVALFEFLRPGYLTTFDMYPARIKERIAPYFLRRRKIDVLPDLPPKQKQEVWLELDAEQRTAYEQIEEQARNELIALGDRVTKMHIFSKIIALKQICNFAPGQFVSSKLESLKEQIDEITDSGQKVIVFSQFIDEGVGKLEKALAPYGPAKIVGQQSESVRNAEIKRFKSSPDTHILLASVKAGGVGLNLTEANYVIHFDHWWNPAVMWQAEARVHRPGQTRGVNVYSYWMQDTIDERIYKTLAEKGLLFENVIDGLSETQLDDLLTKEDLLNLLGVKREAKAQLKVKRDTFEGLSLTEIREKLFEITPARFEQLVGELIYSFGYPNVKITGRTRDGGVDVSASRNTKEGVVRAVAQCKRYRGTVGPHIARELRGVIANDPSIEKGFLVTTGEFTLECTRFCEKSAGTIIPISGLQVANYVRLFGLAI
jgi:superfamily II DNA or RNA helicase